MGKKEFYRTFKPCKSEPSLSAVAAGSALAGDSKRAAGVASSKGSAVGGSAVSSSALTSSLVGEVCSLKKDRK